MRVASRGVVPIVLPALNLALALVLSAIVVVLIGEHPGRALRLLSTGAFGGGEAVGYTLFYATDFVFTGLAVAVAFHAGLFNIGAEGQAYIGGLAVGLLCLRAGGWPGPLVIPAAIVLAGIAGAAWAFVPGWLQARRGSHVVITTIMFNFIASAVMTHLLVNVLIRPGQQSPETREFAASTWLPQLHEIVGGVARSPLNLAFVLALLAGGSVWFYLWHTRWGYELRAFGHSETAAVYAGIRPARTIVVAMTISGALAGMMSLNEVMGFHHRLLLNFPGGAGYVGIAVALMGRNHPLGIVPAAVLFGALYQGGTELSFEMPKITRDMVVVIQGLIILVCGAFEQALRRPIERVFRRAFTEIPPTPAPPREGEGFGGAPREGDGFGGAARS
jgi:simple sugar transport system permease protein